MAAVPGALAPYVTSLMAYDVDLGAPGVHRGLPTTSLTFVLAMGEPLDVGWGDGRGAQEAVVDRVGAARRRRRRSTTTAPSAASSSG